MRMKENVRVWDFERSVTLEWRTGESEVNEVSKVGS